MQKAAHNKYNARQQHLRWLGYAVLACVAILFAVPTLGLSLVGLFAPKAAVLIFGVAHKGVMCAGLGMLGMPRILREAGAGGAGGGGGTATFEEKVLRGVESLQIAQKKQETDIQKVLNDLDRSDKEVKKAMEELTKVKNDANATFEDVMKKMEKVQRQIALNARSSFRNPIERALASEEFRFNMNAIARYMIATVMKDTSKLDPAHKKVIDDAAVAYKALTGVDTGLGQATVPQETFNTIYDLLLEYGDFATLDVQRVGARTNVLPVATGRPQFYWIGSQSSVAEGGQITAGAFTGSQVLLMIQTLAVLMYAARELLQDSTVDLAPYITKQMIISTNWGLDTAAFIGTGNQDTTNGGYVGIFNAALANTNQAYVAAAGRTTVAQLKLDDFVQTMLTVSAQVLNKKPMWWAHAQNIARAALIRDNNGRPIFQTWQEVPNPGAIGSILGHPVHPTAVAPNVDGANTTPFAFGDPDGGVVGIRSDLELATSADIGFPQNLLAFRSLLRAGFKQLTLPASTTLVPFAVLTTAPN